MTRLPGVLEAAVCAVPDEVLGERLCVCIVPETHDDPPQLDDVISFLEGLGLARLKLPEFTRGRGKPAAQSVGKTGPTST